MTKVLLSIHVLAVILAVGPVTIAASMFPRTAREASESDDHASQIAILKTLRRICRVYAGLGVLVPTFGLATAQALHSLGQAWMLVSIVLTAVAAGVLVLLVLPGQDRVLDELDRETASAAPVATKLAVRLAMHTGIFNLLWAVVVVLMISRPGSTTGA